MCDIFQVLINPLLLTDWLIQVMHDWPFNWLFGSDRLTLADWLIVWYTVHLAPANWPYWGNRECVWHWPVIMLERCPFHNSLAIEQETCILLQWLQGVCASFLLSQFSMATCDSDQQAKHFHCQYSLLSVEISMTEWTSNSGCGGTFNSFKDFCVLRRGTLHDTWRRSASSDVVKIKDF